MKILLFYLFLTYLALSVQAIFFSGVKPDLVLVLICSYSLKYGQTRGMIYGALSGLLIDTACGFILGPQTISKSIAGYLAGMVKEHLFQWNLFINTLVIAIFSIINIVLVYGALDAFSKVNFVNRSVEISILEIVYTVIAAVVLYPFLKPEKDRNGHW